MRQLVSALRYCHAPASFPELARLAAQPAQFMIFTAISDTSKTAADFLNIVNAKGNTDAVGKAIALNALLIKTQELEERVGLIVSCLPSMFTFERAKREETLVSAPQWLQRAIRDTRAPGCFHKKYLHINVANSWNWLRHCQIRLLELQILISTRLYESWQPIHLKMKQLEAVADELNSTIVYFLTCDEYGEFNTSDKIEDVRGVKCFFLLRILASAKMALEFVQRRGLDVSAKLGWLGDICGLLETDIGYAVPQGADPMDFDPV